MESSSLPLCRVDTQPRAADDLNSQLSAGNLTASVTALGQWPELTSNALQESHESEPANLCCRKIKATESQVVHYSTKTLLSKKTLCDRAFKATLEREKTYFQSPSVKTLSLLLDQIQTAYVKYWELQRVVELNREDVPKSLLNIPDDMEKFENHIVDFFLTCDPDSPEQNQDLFLTLIWLHNVKTSKNETRSGNFALISKRTLSFFQNDQVINTPIAKVSNRVTCCDPKNQVMLPYEQENLPSIILLGLHNSLPYLFNFRDTELIKINLQKFIAKTELFENYDFSNNTWLDLEKALSLLDDCKPNLSAFRKLAIPDGSQPLFSPKQMDHNYDILLYRAMTYGCPNLLTYSSPDIGLTALEQLIQFIICPDRKQRLMNYIYRRNDFLLHNCEDWIAVLHFLLYGATDNLDEIESKDIRLYLSAVFNYLRNNLNEAVKDLLGSRLPEAPWLLSKITEEKENNLEKAIKYSRIALQRGLKAANLQLALHLIKLNGVTNQSIQEIIPILKNAIEHYQFINAIGVGSYIQGIIDELEFIGTTLASQPLPSEEKGTCQKGKKKGKNRKIKGAGKIENTDTQPPGNDPATTLPVVAFSGEQPDKSDSSISDAEMPLPSYRPESVARSIPRTKLASISLSVTQSLHCNNFTQARNLLEKSCQETQLTIQQASFAHMDLWRLRVLAKESEYLEVLYDSHNHKNSTVEFNILDQAGEVLTEYGLDRKDNENIVLTSDIPEVQAVIRKLAINKALRWLCCLHPCDDPLDQFIEQWSTTPRPTAKRQLNDFEHTLSLTFVTGSFLSLLGHIHSDMAHDCSEKKDKNKLKQKSAEFYSAANEFNKWRNRLKSDQKLSRRIAKATPLGRIQRIKRAVIATHK